MTKENGETDSLSEEQSAALFLQNQENGENADEGDDEVGEAAPEEALFELERNGQVLKVPRSEAIALAQKGWDYTEKTEMLAARGREYDSSMEMLSRMAADQQQFFQYHAAIEVCNQQIKGIEALDLAKIREDNPERYQELMDKKRELREIRSEAADSMEGARAALQQSHGVVQQRRINENKAILARDIPGWGDAIYSEILDYAVAQGVDRSVATQIIDAPFIKMARKAMLYDKAVNGAKGKRRDPAGSTGIRPGSAKKDRTSPKDNVLAERLRKTGSLNDAAKLFERLF